MNFLNFSSSVVVFAFLQVFDAMMKVELKEPAAARKRVVVAVLVVVIVLENNDHLEEDGMENLDSFFFTLAALLDEQQEFSLGFEILKEFRER